MVHHVVCFRLHEHTPAERVAEAAKALLAMKGRIPEIRDIRFGPNLAPSATEYSHVLTVVCDDMDAVNRYMAHPLHVQTVNDYVAPIRAARLAIDLEY